jgi:hypothetical protein
MVRGIEKFRDNLPRLDLPVPSEQIFETFCKAFSVK